MNKLTLAIAAYNVGSFIGECLESLQKQTCRDFDLLVVDDGSTDGTDETVNRFLPSFPGARVERQTNAGISFVRNRMLDLCQTEYMWMIDGDDVIPPDAVERLLPCLDGTREAVYFTYSRYGETEKRVLTGKLFDLTPEQIQALRYKSMLNDKEPLIQNINANSTVMCAYRMEMLRAHQLRFEPGRGVGKDVLYTSSFLRWATKLAYLDASLYLYRVNEGSVSLKYQKGLTATNEALMTVFQTYVRENYPDDAHMQQLLLGRVLGTASASIQLEICHPHNHEAYGVRRAAYLEMLQEPMLADAILHCPESLIRRNVKVYRALMRKRAFFLTNAFARLIMRKRYIVFRAHGGKVRK